MSHLSQPTTDCSIRRNKFKFSSWSFLQLPAQIFEWWYFRKYGTSFIEQVSLNHLSPWLGGGAEEPDNPAPESRGPPSAPSTTTTGECKVWRNPLSLLRGAEYARFLAATRREPLTFYDMNLSAQDHQTLFACEADAGHPDCEGMHPSFEVTYSRFRLRVQVLSKAESLWLRRSICRVYNFLQP